MNVQELRALTSKIALDTLKKNPLVFKNPASKNEDPKSNKEGESSSCKASEIEKGESSMQQNVSGEIEENEIKENSSDEGSPAKLMKSAVIGNPKNGHSRKRKLSKGNAVKDIISDLNQKMKTDEDENNPMSDGSELEDELNIEKNKKQKIAKGKKSKKPKQEKRIKIKKENDEKEKKLKPKNAWILFSSDEYPKMKEKNPNMKTAEIQGQLAKKWNLLKEEGSATVEYYNNLYAESMKAYKLKQDSQEENSYDCDCKEKIENLTNEKNNVEKRVTELLEEIGIIKEENKVLLTEKNKNLTAFEQSKDMVNKLLDENKKLKALLKSNVDKREPEEKDFDEKEKIESQMNNIEEEVVKESSETEHKENNFDVKKNIEGEMKINVDKREPEEKDFVEKEQIESQMNNIEEEVVKESSETENKENNFDVEKNIEGEKNNVEEETKKEGCENELALAQQKKTMLYGYKPEVGECVLVKIIGYPRWPAKVMAIKGDEFSVKFYGDFKTGDYKASAIKKLTSHDLDEMMKKKGSKLLKKSILQVQSTPNII